MCRATKWGVQVGELPVLPHRPYYQPWVSFGTRDLTCEPGLEPLLPEHSPAGNSDWRAWPQPPEVHKALCQPGLLEHKHGLCAVLGGQVEAVCEVVLPPQEGIEVIRDEQDLGGERGCEVVLQGISP